MKVGYLKSRKTWKKKFPLVFKVKNQKFRCKFLKNMKFYLNKYYLIFWAKKYAHFFKIKSIKDGVKSVVLLDFIPISPKFLVNLISSKYILSMRSIFINFKNSKKDKESEKLRQRILKCGSLDEYLHKRLNQLAARWNRTDAERPTDVEKEVQTVQTDKIRSDEKPSQIPSEVIKKTSLSFKESPSQIQSKIVLKRSSESSKEKPRKTPDEPVIKRPSEVLKKSSGCTNKKPRKTPDEPVIKRPRESSTKKTAQKPREVIKRPRGRPKGSISKKPSKTPDEPVVKRPRGRPKGSISKKPSKTPDEPVVKRPRGRPKCWTKEKWIKTKKCSIGSTKMVNRKKKYKKSKHSRTGKKSLRKHKMTLREEICCNLCCSNHSRNKHAVSLCLRKKKKEKKKRSKDPAPNKPDQLDFPIVKLQRLDEQDIKKICSDLRKSGCIKCLICSKNFLQYKSFEYHKENKVCLKMKLRKKCPNCKRIFTWRGFNQHTLCNR